MLLCDVLFRIFNFLTVRIRVFFCGSCTKEKPPNSFSGHWESPEAKAQRIVEEAPRTTYVLGCPSDITEGELMEQFPAAETTQLMFRAGKFTGTAAVIFATAAEAEKAAAQRTSEVRGRRVSIQMGGVPLFVSRHFIRFCSFQRNEVFVGCSA